MLSAVFNDIDSSNFVHFYDPGSIAFVKTLTVASLWLIRHYIDIKIMIDTNNRIYERTD